MADDVMISADELANLRAIATMSGKVYDHPKAGPEMQKLIKDVFPHARVPELELRQALEPEVAALRKERDEFRKEREDEKLARARAAAIGDIKADSNLRVTDEEIPEIEKIMAEEGVRSYNAAAHAFRRRQEIARPTGAPDFEGSRMWLPGQKMRDGKAAGGDDMTGLWDNPTQWSQDMIVDTIRQSRAGTLDPKWTA